MFEYGLIYNNLKQKKWHTNLYNTMTDQYSMTYNKAFKNTKIYCVCVNVLETYQSSRKNSQKLNYLKYPIFIHDYYS